MRSPLDWKAIAGILALLVTFVLALPGVKAVRAEDDWAAATSSDGPQCHNASPEAEIAKSGATIEQVQAQLLAQLAAQGGTSTDTPILLNNRGYNYGSGTPADRIAADAQRLQSQH